MRKFKRGEPVVHNRPGELSFYCGVAGASLPDGMRELMADTCGTITRLVVPESEIAEPFGGRQLGVIPYGTPATVADGSGHEHEGMGIGIFGRINGTYIAALRSPVQYKEEKLGTRYESESFPISYDDIEIEPEVRAGFSLWEKLSWRPNLSDLVKVSVLRRAGGKCEGCGSPGRWPENLAIHHCTYARWGFEQPQDLMALCRKCHTSKHTDGDLWHNDPEQRAAEMTVIWGMIEGEMQRGS